MAAAQPLVPTAPEAGASSIYLLPAVDQAVHDTLLLLLCWVLCLCWVSGLLGRIKPMVSWEWSYFLWGGLSGALFCHCCNEKKTNGGENETETTNLKATLACSSGLSQLNVQQFRALGSKVIGLMETSSSVAAHHNCISLRGLL